MRFNSEKINKVSECELEKLVSEILQKALLFDRSPQEKVGDFIKKYYSSNNFIKYLEAKHFNHRLK